MLNNEYQKENNETDLQIPIPQRHESHDDRPHTYNSRPLPDDVQLYRLIPRRPRRKRACQRARITDNR